MTYTTNDAYLRIHNARTMLELVVSYLENNDGNEVDTIYYALKVAADEAKRAEEALGGVHE